MDSGAGVLVLDCNLVCHTTVLSLHGQKQREVGGIMGFLRSPTVVVLHFFLFVFFFCLPLA